MPKKTKTEIHMYKATQLLLCECTLVTDAEDLEEAKDKFKRGRCTSQVTGKVLYQTEPSDITLIEFEGNNEN